MGAAHSTSSCLSNKNLTPLETVCGQGPPCVRGDGDISVVKAETNQGLVQGGLPSVRMAEVVFPAAASSLFAGPSRVGLLAAGCDRASGGTIQAVLVDGGSLTRDWLCHSSPHPWLGMGTSRRGQRCPRSQGWGLLRLAQRGSSFPSPMTRLSHGPARVRGTGDQMKLKPGAWFLPSTVSHGLRPHCSTRRCCPPSEPPPAQTCAAAGSSGPWGLPPGQS